MLQMRKTLEADHDRSNQFAPIEDAIKAIRAGEIVIVADDEDRENEGDLTMAVWRVQNFDDLTRHPSNTSS